jgi:hypothetical protein
MLEPCPFCGASAAVHTLDEGGPVRFFVTCQNSYCGASGSNRSTRDQAMFRWNDRCHEAPIEDEQLRALIRDLKRLSGILESPNRRFMWRDGYDTAIRIRDELTSRFPKTCSAKTTLGRRCSAEHGHTDEHRVLGGLGSSESWVS